MVPLKVYLCDLTHETVILVSDTIPLNLGFIGSYAKKIHGNAIEISLFKYPKTAIDAIKKHQAVYLMAVGGAAFLVSKAIRNSKVVAFADLGMEDIHEFEVENMPVTVAVDSNGTSVHETGPRIWKARIGKIPVVQE